MSLDEDAASPSDGALAAFAVAAAIAACAAARSATKVAGSEAAGGAGAGVGGVAALCGIGPTSIKIDGPWVTCASLVFAECPISPRVSLTGGPSCSGAAG